MRYLFVINRSSGTTRNPDRLAHAIEDWLRSSARSGVVRTTRTLEELDQVWNGSDLEQADAVCAVGGDGTVLEIGRRLAGTRRHLGIIPLGSGNGFARHIGMPMKPRHALDALESAIPTPVDTGLADGRRFLGTFGVGFDAVVAHAFAQAGSRGLSTYVRVGTNAFFRHRAETFRIRVDGVESEETAILLTIGNSGQYGNEARFVPHASLRDGLLDVCVLRTASPLDAPRILRRLFEGRFDECAEVCLMRGKRIEIERSERGPAHLDGDPLFTDRKIEVRVDPRSLSVLVPRDALPHI